MFCSSIVLGLDEMQELRGMLAKDMVIFKRDALKRLLALMLMGQDVTGLFPDVIKCLGTTDLELKRLVDLYLVACAKTQPDLAILSINTLCKVYMFHHLATYVLKLTILLLAIRFLLGTQDTADPNPLIRMLALRTMSGIRVARLLDYIAEPLQRLSRDKDPAIRRTVALAIAKVGDMDRDFVEECALDTLLRELALADKSAMVRSVALGALSDLVGSNQNVDKSTVDDGDESPRGATFSLSIDSPLWLKGLLGVEECGEWGIVHVLDALPSHIPPEHSNTLLKHCLPLLQHANPAVVFGAVKTVLSATAAPDRSDKKNDSQKDVQLAVRMGQALLSAYDAANASWELQWAMLRCMRAHVDRIAFKPLPMLACTWGEPLPVAREKILLLQAIVACSNDCFAGTPHEDILDQLSVYATGPRSLSKIAIRALGGLEPARLAHLLESSLDNSDWAIEACIQVLPAAAVKDRMLPRIALARMRSEQGRLAQLALVQRLPDPCLTVLHRAHRNLKRLSWKVRCAVLDVAFLSAAKQGVGPFNSILTLTLDALLNNDDELDEGGLWCREKARLYRIIYGKTHLLGKALDAIESVPLHQPTKSITTQSDGVDWELMRANWCTTTSVLLKRVCGARPVFANQLDANESKFKSEDKSKTSVNEGEGYDEEDLLDLLEGPWAEVKKDHKQKPRSKPQSDDDEDDYLKEEEGNSKSSDFEDAIEEAEEEQIKDAKPQSTTTPILLGQKKKGGAGDNPPLIQL